MNNTENVENINTQYTENETIINPIKPPGSREIARSLLKKEFWKYLIVDEKGFYIYAYDEPSYCHVEMSRNVLLKKLFSALPGSPLSRCQEILDIILIEHATVDEKVNLKNPKLCAFQNNIVVDLVTLQTFKPSPHLFCFNKIPLNYLSGGNKNQAKDICFDFLNTLCNYNPGNYYLLMCWLRKFLAKDVDDQKILVMVGPGATGKSTFGTILRLFAGNRVIGTSIKSLASNFETHLFEDQNLILLSEIKGQLDTESGSVLKQITGNDTISSRKKYSNSSFDFVNETASLFLTGNSLLAFAELDSGMERRLSILFTENIVSETMRQPMLNYKKKGFTGQLYPFMEELLRSILQINLDEARHVCQTKVFFNKIDVLGYTNPLRVFFEENLSLLYNPRGIKLMDYKNHYNLYCESKMIPISKPQDFKIALQNEFLRCGLNINLITRIGGVNKILTLPPGFALPVASRVDSPTKMPVLEQLNPVNQAVEFQQSKELQEQEQEQEQEQLEFQQSLEYEQLEFQQEAIRNSNILEVKNVKSPEDVISLLYAKYDNFTNIDKVLQMFRLVNETEEERLIRLSFSSHWSQLLKNESKEEYSTRRKLYLKDPASKEYCLRMLCIPFELEKENHHIIYAHMLCTLNNFLLLNGKNVNLKYQICADFEQIWGKRKNDVALFKPLIKSNN